MLGPLDHLHCHQNYLRTQEDMRIISHLASQSSSIPLVFIDDTERSKHPLFTTERFSFDLCPTAYPLRVFVNRYTPHEPCEDGFTLVLIHATTMHKETWEPTIAKLLSPAQPGKHRIHEVYSFEQPNHGESAVYNAKAIQQVYGDEWSLRDCANAFNMLLTGHPSSGFTVDFSKRKLVGIGHSGGATIFSLMHAVPTSPPMFYSLIMIEPGLSSYNIFDARTGSRMLCELARTRKDTWTSRESARASLSSNVSHAGIWDRRILDLYVRYALTAHPASTYEGTLKFTGVTTAISRAQEIACYCNDDLYYKAIKAYTSLFSRPTPIRVHIIYGAELSPGIITPNMQHFLCDTSMGHFPTSVRHILGASHLAVQQRPDDVGCTIACVLDEDAQQLQADKMIQPMQSKL